MNAIASFILFSIIGNLPLRMRQLLGRMLGRLVSWFPSREREIAQLQIAGVGISDAPKRVVSKVFESLGTSIMESLNPRDIIDTDKIKLSPDGEATLSRIHASGKGVLALTAHYGNWDLLGGYFASREIPVVTVGRYARSALVQHLLCELRSRLNIHTIWRDDPGGIREIIRTLKQGGIIAALIDQDTLVGSDFYPFFNRPAKTPVSLITLAIRTQSNIVVSFLERTKDGFQVTLQEIPNSLPLSEIVQTYHTMLENQIRRDPSQWVWFHKRWRSSPDFGTLGTREYLSKLRNHELFT